MRRLVPLIVALALLGPAQSAPAFGPGSADARFGGDSDISTGFTAADPARAGWPAPRPLAVTADGALLSAGVESNEADAGGAVVVRRFTPGGEPDPAWGTAGAVRLRELDESQVERPAYAVDVLVALPDGGVLGAGRDADGTLAAMRLDAAGAVMWQTSPRPGPAVVAGRATPDGAAAAWRQTGAAALDDRGGVFVAGAAAGGMAVVRLDLATGALDPAFGTRVEPVGACAAMAAGAVALPDGGVAVGGTGSRCAGANPLGALVLYGADGARRVSRSGPTLGLRTVAGLAPTPDGELVATGAALGARRLPGRSRTREDRPPPTTVAAVARFDGGGTLRWSRRIGRGDASDVAVGSDGRIYAAAERFGGVLRRLLADGRRDRSWDFASLAQSGIVTPRTIVVGAGGGALVAASGDGGLLLAALRGGRAVGRASVGALRARPDGRLALDVRCSAAPGCEGDVVVRDRRGRLVSQEIDSVLFGLANNGRVVFGPLRAGGRERLRFDVVRTPRTVTVTITNPPALPVVVRRVVPRLVRRRVG